MAYIVKLVRKNGSERYLKDSDDEGQAIYTENKAEALRENAAAEQIRNLWGLADGDINKLAATDKGLAILLEEV